MNCIKIQFCNEIPADEVIKLWSSKFGIFRTPDLIIKKNVDEKTLIATFQGVSRSFIEYLKDLCEKISEAYSIEQVFARAGEYGDTDFFIYGKTDTENMAIQASSYGINDLSLKEMYKFLKFFGFERNFIRFALVSEATEIVLDHTIPDDYYEKFLGK